MTEFFYLLEIKISKMKINKKTKESHEPRVLYFRLKPQSLQVIVLIRKALLAKRYNQPKIRNLIMLG